MKKIKIYSVVIVIFASIVAVLLHNRSQIRAETRNLNVSSYAVTTTTVEKQDIRHDLDLVGTINANNDVKVVSEASGKVTKVLVSVGDYEPAGNVLVQLDDKLQTAALALAKVNLDKATKDYERYQNLYNGHSVTDAQLESAELAYESANDQFVVARRQYNNTRITSPISGIATSRSVDMGTYVNPGMVVAEVVDISRLKVTVNVAEQDIMSLSPGNKVGISTDVYPGVKFAGFIKTISSKGDADHTYPVEVDFTNSREHPLKAGMFAHLYFAQQSSPNSLVIPRQALVGSVEKPQVFVVEDGVARLKNIVVGSTYNNFLEVLSGLHEGETVVSNGQNNLEDGYKVNVVN
jgi:RND family efflux transporter MFP subunit